MCPPIGKVAYDCAIMSERNTNVKYLRKRFSQVALMRPTNPFALCFRSISMSNKSLLLQHLVC